MKYRKLGKTELQVAEIGMGTWQLVNDPNMWVGADLNEATRALHKYIELGGNFLDTAWVYGYDSDDQPFPTAESHIGKFLKETGKRDSLVIASKVAPKNWTWPALKAVPFSEVFPKEHVEKLVHESLTRLGTDYVDLMQFHVWQDDWATIDEWKEVTEKLTKEGKVRHWGISINDYQPSNCLKTLETGLIGAIQCIFNVFHQKPTEKLFPYAKQHDIGIIARTPLDEGGLSGNIMMDTVFAEGDFRNEYFGPANRAELIRHVDALREIVTRYPEVSSVSELALRYILSFDEVTSVIPGMRKVKYVEEDMRISDLGKLSAELMDELKKHVWERSFAGRGKRDPWLESSGYVEV